MNEPTKTALREVVRLREENEQLRDLITAVHLAAGSVPQAVYDDRLRELDRARSVLEIIALETDLKRDMPLWVMTQSTREHAAVPVAYRPYEPEPFAADIDRINKAASVIGRLVADAHDDSPCPTLGKVVGQVDEETLEVAWGDQRFVENPRSTREPVDALRPAREGSRF